MRFKSLAALCVVVLAGCYHVTVETGLPASSEVISKAWAHSFIAGLVPPATLETAAKCKNGVAKVETQMSFVNMLAGFLTSSIYTPMQIDVTCASSNKMSLAPADVIKAKDSSPVAIQRAIAEAAAISEQTGRAAFVVLQ